jgi:hypothetical protein
VATPEHPFHNGCQVPHAAVERAARLVARPPGAKFRPGGQDLPPRRDGTAELDEFARVADSTPQPRDDTGAPPGSDEVGDPAGEQHRDCGEQRPAAAGRDGGRGRNSGRASHLDEQQRPERTCGRNGSDCGGGNPLAFHWSYHCR